MFGNDNGGDGGDDHGFGLGQLLFGLWLWRELDSGRIDAGGIFKVLFLVAAVIGGGFLVLLAIAGASVPQYAGSLDYATPYAWPTEAPAFVPAWTPQADIDAHSHRDPVAHAEGETAPRHRQEGPGRGRLVGAGRQGRALAALVVPRARLAPGHRVHHRRHAGRGGRLRLGRHVLRHGPERALVHRLAGGRSRTRISSTAPTTTAGTQAKGWVTFEVRDKDAKGLVLTSCVPEMFGCTTDHGSGWRSECHA